MPESITWTKSKIFTFFVFTENLPTSVLDETTSNSDVAVSPHIYFLTLSDILILFSVFSLDIIGG